MADWNYNHKDKIMKLMFANWQTPKGFRSTFKGVPMTDYETFKEFIDFTKYYVVFRGPRPRFGQCSTRKRDAKAFDVYQRSVRDTMVLRAEREGFWRGVEYASK